MKSLTISGLAQAGGVGVETVRYYQRRGLLKTPQRPPGSAHVRRYSDDDINRARRIQELTTAGLNLAGVKRVLDLEAQLDEMRQMLEETRAAAQAALDRTHRQYRRDLVPLKQAVALFNR